MIDKNVQAIADPADRFAYQCWKLAAGVSKRVTAALGVCVSNEPEVFLSDLLLDAVKPIQEKAHRPRWQSGNAPPESLGLHLVRCLQGDYAIGYFIRDPPQWYEEETRRPLFVTEFMLLPKADERLI